MAKKRAFISFDFDNDKVLKDFAVGQARLEDSPFEIEDWSMKEAAPQANWEREAEIRIARSDVVIVMVGPQTHRAPGVLKEIAIARRRKIPVCQFIGYKDANPKSVANAGTLRRWTWNNFKNVLG